MFIKKSVAVISALVVLAAGYVAGLFIGLPNVDNSKLNGDIRKAVAYNQADSEEVQAALEQLANDKDLQAQITMAAAILDVRIDQIKELVTYIIEEEGDLDEEEQEELIEEVAELCALDNRIKNTREAYDQYLETLVAIVKGEKTEGFEQKANNALLAYTIVERNFRAVAPDVANKLLQIAENKKSQKAADLAAKWIQYASEDAFMSDSKSDMEYWQTKVDAIGNNPVLSGMIESSTLSCINEIVLTNSIASKLANKNVLAGIGSSNVVGYGNKPQDVLENIPVVIRAKIIDLTFSPIIIRQSSTDNAARLKQKPSPC